MHCMIMLLLPLQTHLIPNAINIPCQCLSQRNSRKEARSGVTFRYYTLNIDIPVGALMRTPHLQQNEAAAHRRIEAYGTLALIPLDEESRMGSHQFTTNCSHSLLRGNLTCFFRFR